MATSAPPRATGSLRPQITLASISTGGNDLPNRYIIHAVEGFGKTSISAQFPKPVFVQSRGETGLQTLINANRLKPTPSFPEAQAWEEIIGSCRALLQEPHEYRTLAIDTLNGAERLCHEYTCAQYFNNDWTDKGFASYQKGPEVALSEWRQLLGLLDELRAQRKMTVVALCHTKIAPYKNPLGPDYDRFQPDVDKRTWSLTAKWADAILFGNFETAVTAVKENKRTGEQKGKGIGGNVRILYTERTAAYDAKNRLGLPPEIEMGESPEQAWQNFLSALKSGREVSA